jgi:hypothetical protein
MNDCAHAFTILITRVELPIREPVEGEIYLPEPFELKPTHQHCVVCGEDIPMEETWQDD